MAEITAAGYTALREAIAAWFVEFRDDAGDPIPLTGAGRLDASDSRVTVTDSTDDQTVTFTVELAGADIDAALPVTVASAVLYAAADGGTPLSEVEPLEPAGFVFSAPSDEVTVTFPVEAPQQV